MLGGQDEPPEHEQTCWLYLPFARLFWYAQEIRWKATVCLKSLIISYIITNLPNLLIKDFEILLRNYLADLCSHSWFHRVVALRGTFEKKAFSQFAYRPCSFQKRASQQVIVSFFLFSQSWNVHLLNTESRTRVTFLVYAFEQFTVRQVTVWRQVIFSFLRESFNSNQSLWNSQICGDDHKFYYQNR